MRRMKPLMLWSRKWRVCSIVHQKMRGEFKAAAKIKAADRRLSINF
jgi:hypothetical protein